MKGIADIYTQSVYENLRPLFGNWEPSQPVELGDYGTLYDAIFIHEGNIKDLKMKFDVRSDTKKSHKSFSSKGSASTAFHSKGSTTIDGVANANATLEINFSSEDAVFFNAAQCKFDMIKDKDSIGQEIMKRYEKGDWEKKWAVITDMVSSGSTTIAISGGKSSSVVFEAKGDVDRINLADASVGLNVSSQKNIGYIVEAQEGLIPLIGLSKIQSKFLKPGEFEPITDHSVRVILSTIRNSSKIRMEESSKDLYFGQIKG